MAKQSSRSLAFVVSGVLAAGCNGGGLTLVGDAGVDACAASCPDPCTGKNESTCKSTPACVADYCPKGCVPVFVGCRSTTSPMPSCPEPGCTACRSRQDCPSTQPLACVEPGEPLCGGPACMLPPCNSDAFCQANGGGSNMVCDFPTCDCHGMKVCIPGCSSPSDCVAGQTCSTSHHCVPIPCGACPTHFICGASGFCDRQPCTTDADCHGGFCVNSACYDSLGVCSPIPA
jgi:hypothetical protein